jgi:hypothetical protein
MWVRELENDMPTVLFNFVRDLKISRFTIDVLMQRLDQLKPRRHCGPDEYEHLLGETNEGVADCDHLLNDLRDRFGGVQLFDAGSIASLNAAFEELHRKITESITNCNVFEFGPPHRSARSGN